MFAANTELYGSAGTFFANGSFFFLFLAMTLYWVDLAFFDFSPSLNAFKAPFGGILYSAANGFGKYSIFLASLSLVALLSFRWFDSGHFPLSNLYESLMFLSWSCTSVHLFFSFVYVKGSTSKITPLAIEPVKFEKLLGAILAPLALFLNAFATFSLPKEMQLAGPLVPALQSNWLMMHVTVMIISYAALILGSLLSIVFVIAIWLRRESEIQNSATATALRLFRKTALALPVNFLNPDVSRYGSAKSESVTSNTPLAALNILPVKNAQTPEKLSLALNNLDYLSYRIIGIGFPFLTIGILSGAVWANEAWGSYWSWDPKETWALLTWLVFAIYLHTRITKGWDGEKPALIASLGFIVVWICYLGVNLLGEGLHSYGFLVSK
uniref:Cytochrome c biogenesis protein CcsA n=1 Tax=Chlamydomonas peterfii TaxID=28462 RepID=A0A0S2IDB7_9CHLO|nr:heme attachment to plastid cytochrome c [Chlamydomonas peterfii]